MPIGSRRTVRSSRRAKREKRRRIALILCAVLVVFGVGAGLWYLLTLPVFTIQHIEVRGTEALAPQDIQQFAENELLGRYAFLIPKRSVFFYPRQALLTGLSDTFSRLEKAEVRLLSAGTLAVFVTERRAAAKLCAAECFLIDESGFVFAPDPGRSDVLRFRTKTAVSVGGHFLTPERLIPLLAFLKGLPGLGFSLSEVRIEGDEGDILLRGGAHLHFRLEPDYGKLLKRLETLVSERELFSKGVDSIERLEYIDLRYGNKVYFKPR